jgi:hypothetical protein
VLARDLAVVLLGVELGRLLLEREPIHEAVSERSYAPSVAETLTALQSQVVQVGALSPVSGRDEARGLPIGGA